MGDRTSVAEVPSGESIALPARVVPSRPIEPAVSDSIGRTDGSRIDRSRDSHGRITLHADAVGFGVTMSDSRDRGIEFGDLEEELEQENYPLSNDEVIERYGDRELVLSRGTTTVREVLGDIEADEYEDHEQLHEAMLNMVGSEAVGEEDYSERGTAMEEGEDTDAF